MFDVALLPTDGEMRDDLSLLGVSLKTYIVLIHRFAGNSNSGRSGPAAYTYLLLVARTHTDALR